MSKQQKKRFGESDLRALGLVEVRSGVWEKPKEGETAVITEKSQQKPKKLPETGFFKGLSHFEICQKHSGANGIYIPYEVPSSKNGRQLGVKDGKPISVPSKQTREYVAQTKKIWQAMAPVFQKLLQEHESPYLVSFFFVRRTAGIFDLANAVQICQDMMQEHEWIENDEANILVPDFRKWYAIDKFNPGVIIEILKW